MGRRPTRNKNLPQNMRARHRSNGKTYYAYDTGENPRREIQLGTDYVLAVQKWAELEADRTEKFTNLATFRYAAEKYIREVIPTKAPRTQSDNLKELKFLYQFFDNPPAPLNEIQAVHINQYMNWRVEKARDIALAKNTERVAKKLAPLKLTGKEGQVRANREKALFSHIFNMARSWGLTNASNPCAGIKGYTETGRDVYVEDDIFWRVYEAADQPTRDAMDLAYLTGQRPADTVKYSEDDIKDGFLELEQNKTRKKLRIQIIGKLETVINRILAKKRHIEATGKTGIVPRQLIVNEQGQKFTQGALASRFYDIRKLLGVSGGQFQFRDLRAKAGTDKAEETGDIRQAQKQLGHSSVLMTERYTRTRKGDKVKPTK